MLLPFIHLKAHVMKYEPIDDQPKPEQREDLNHRIAHLIHMQRTQELSPRNVFYQFTGKGALHGLDFKDYGSYASFSQAKKELEMGQFFTPDALCEQIILALRPPRSFKIGDITCGKGSFFNHLPTENNIYGNELDSDACEVCRYLFPEAHLENKDFLEYDPKVPLDMIIGNPPFNIKTEEGSSQFAFVKRAHKLLAYNGLLAFIVPMSFLSDDFQDNHKITWINEHFNFVLQAELPRDAFDVAIRTKLIILQRKGFANSHEKYAPIRWEHFDPARIYPVFIQPLIDPYFDNRAKNKRLRADDQAEVKDINYLIKRRLWHIKESKRLKVKYYPRALAKLKQLQTQVKPPEMTDTQWDRHKMTPEKLLGYLEGVVKTQNAKPARMAVKLVKTAYGIRYKPYHPKLRKSDKKVSIHDILLNDEQDYGHFNRLFRKKRQDLELQNTPFTELNRCPQVDQFLESVSLEPEPIPGVLFQPDNIPTIRPNGMQKTDLGLLLQKRNGILAWEQGGGKSVAGMIWLKYHEKQYKNCFVVGPAIAIGGTWTRKLKQYGFRFQVLEKYTDFAKIKPGQLLLLSFDALIRLERYVRRFVKLSSGKIGLLVDESDELTNSSSQRSKASLNCFRRAKYKLLTTGTTTRNSINELYTQLELLYNNSTAFICHTETAYYVDQEGELQEYSNEYYRLPFPAYFGNTVFQASFCPLKSTVFGIRKDNQDVFNEQILKDLINKTIITRKFEEIVGEKRYTIHVEHVKQKPAERSLYTLLMKDFLKVAYDYYKSTGNHRKEAALRLVRQMKVLINATSIPHKMRNYVGDEIPQKFEFIGKLVGKWPDQVVTIGCTTKQTAKLYLRYLAKLYPNRKMFYIDGEISVENRMTILALLEQSKNGILVCTQQALKSSVNVPFCSKAIIESLQWNIPRISQFYFRFIRFDSLRHADIYIVNYLDTIEINLMALLMAKEKLNDFIKTTNRTTTAEIYEEFGIDIDILDMLIQKTYDQEGNLHLSWGQQRLAA
jgi:N-6 DNA Methylase/SNF2-related domain